MTLFSSSPRSTPDARPCSSWRIAACADEPDAPERRSCLFSCSANCTISLELLNASPAIVPIWETRPMVSMKSPRERMDAA